jgi:FAD/FMN-containing dehydrogenase
MFLKSFVSIAGLALAASAAGVTDLRKMFQSQLSSQSEVILSSDPNATTPRWTIFETPSFSVIVKAGNEKDAATAIKIAQKNKIPFLATGNGHGTTTTYGALNNGLQLDLSKFKSIVIDKTGDSMTIGPGVTFSEIIGPVAAAGREIQTGSCGCVGMIGATLGGGIGRYQGLHGVILDALLSVRFLTANGDILTASKTSNPELFYGIRGAGANLGIVLSATYKLYPQTNNGEATVWTIQYPGAANGSLYQAVADLKKDGSIPQKLSLFVGAGWLPASTFGAIVIAVYAGPADEGRKIVKNLISVPGVTPVAALTEATVPWKDILSAAAIGEPGSDCVRGLNRDPYSAAIKDFDVPTFVNYFNSLSTFVTANPELRATVWELEVLANQAVVAVPDGETAYHIRDAFAQTLTVFQFPAGDAAWEKKVNAFAVDGRTKFAKTSGYKHLELYVNYGHGDEGVNSWYGDRNVARLTALKKKYDPTNQFRFNNPLVKAT